MVHEQDAQRKRGAEIHFQTEDGRDFSAETSKVQGSNTVYIFFYRSSWFY